MISCSSSKAPGVFVSEQIKVSLANKVVQHRRRTFGSAPCCIAGNWGLSLGFVVDAVGRGPQQALEEMALVREGGLSLFALRFP